MNTIHFVMMGKGGVGKSMSASLLAQCLVQKQRALFWPPLETWPTARRFGKILYQPATNEYRNDEATDQPVCRT